MELFFDLAYVFAITQLTQTLLHDLTWPGTLKVLILFGAVWWVWNYTAWTTGFVDPNRLPVRLFMVVSMFLCVVMSASIRRPSASAACSLRSRSFSCRSDDPSR